MPRVRLVAVRRQSLVALALVVAVVIENARSGSSDTVWEAVVLVSVVLALLCLSPAAIASTSRRYRIAATVLALLLTAAAVAEIAGGSVYAVPAAVVAWLTTAPINQTRVG
jgi:hypothetical protein